jgi:hypothetical protein
MPITERFDENAKLFECLIHLTALHSEQDLVDAMAEFAKAIDCVANNMHESDIWHFGITVSVKKGLIKVVNSGTSIRAVRLIARNRDSWESRNAWKSVCPEFWIAAFQFLPLQPLIGSILDKIENLLMLAKSAGRSTASLWEDEQTQFAEPLVSLLALHDVRFVDSYRRLMNQWDMEHEFQQFDIINTIVHVHGICEETEQLLYDRCVVSAGQNGENQIEELYPLLQQTYGEFNQSRLFQRIVTEMHNLDMLERHDALQDYEHRKLEHPEAKPRPRNEPPFHYSDNADLKLGASRIFASLDASHRLSHFL